MFININNNNYFIDIKGKSVHQIYDELIIRMNTRFISPKQKQSIISQISKQIRKSS